MNDRRKCMIALRTNGNKNVPAYLIGQAPLGGIERPHKIAAGSDDKLTYTTDALVELMSFDKGAVYQLPFDQIKLVDKWDDEYDYEPKKRNRGRKKDFEFPAEVREYVRSLAELMYYANSRNDGMWASQSVDQKQNGVYGHAQDTITAIIREVCNERVAVEYKDHLNLGGNKTFFDDVEVAVADAIHAINNPDD